MKLSGTASLCLLELKLTSTPCSLGIMTIEQEAQTILDTICSDVI